MTGETEATRETAQRALVMIGASSGWQLRQLCLPCHLSPQGRKGKELAVKRPKLCEVPLGAVLPPKPGRCYCTMSEGQWDTLLETAYQLGWVLLELDEDEHVLRAYQRRWDDN